MADISFGPAGLGGVKEAVSNLEKYSKNGLKACEISFTRGVYIKPEEAKIIAEAAKKLGIELTIHSQYWVNLNSEEEIKIEQSKKRILECCRIGELLGATRVVFHPGYYGKKNPQESYEKIKREVSELVDEIKNNGWKIRISAETTGKISVFGSIEETLKLSEETGCDVCVDFAHLKARSLGKQEYHEMIKRFNHLKELHVHFSGIEYGDKGERNHKVTPPEEIKKFIKALLKGSEKSGLKRVTVINESPTPYEDSIKLLSEYEKQRKKQW